MKVVIAGIRYKDPVKKIPFSDYKLVVEAVERSGFEITEEVCGDAIGVDSLGERWAIANNVPIKKMPANFTKYGKAGGPIRNREMAEYADAAVIVWDGKSNGTRNMINEMIRKNKPYFIMMTESEDVPPE